MELKQLHKTYTKRILIYLLGLVFLSFGTGFAINARVGISPVASLPYVSAQILPLTVGTIKTSLFLIIILLQIIILRKQFKWINLTQIIFSTIFGFLVDGILLLFQNMFVEPYLLRLLMLGLAICLTSIGIVLFMAARLVPLPPEGLCAAIEAKNPKIKFATAKIIVDVSLVSAAIATALIFTGGLGGIREGTVISAFLIGLVIPVVKKIFRKIFPKLGV